MSYGNLPVLTRSALTVARVNAPSENTPKTSTTLAPVYATKTKQLPLNAE